MYTVSLAELCQIIALYSQYTGGGINYTLHAIIRSYRTTKPYTTNLRISSFNNNIIMYVNLIEHMKKTNFDFEERLNFKGCQLLHKINVMRIHEFEKLISYVKYTFCQNEYCSTASTVDYCSLSGSLDCQPKRLVSNCPTTNHTKAYRKSSTCSVVRGLLQLKIMRNFAFNSIFLLQVSCKPLCQLRIKYLYISYNVIKMQDYRMIGTNNTIINFVDSPILTCLLMTVLTPSAVLPTTLRVQRLSFTSLRGTLIKVIEPLEPVHVQYQVQIVCVQP